MGCLQNIGAIGLMILAEFVDSERAWKRWTCHLQLALMVYYIQLVPSPLWTRMDHLQNFLRLFQQTAEPLTVLEVLRGWIVGRYAYFLKGTVLVFACTSTESRHRFVNARGFYRVREI